MGSTTAIVHGLSLFQVVAWTVFLLLPPGEITGWHYKLAMFPPFHTRPVTFNIGLTHVRVHHSTMCGKYVGVIQDAERGAQDRNSGVLSQEERDATRKAKLDELSESERPLAAVVAFFVG